MRGGRVYRSALMLFFLDDLNREISLRTETSHLGYKPGFCAGDLYRRLFHRSTRLERLSPGHKRANPFIFILGFRPFFNYLLFISI